jgi:hypothetical protein
VKPAAWIVDIDGTLALRTERRWFDWHRVGEDLPNEPVVRLVRALRRDRYEILFLSGRKEQCHPQTMRWLREVAFLAAWPAHLFMRADNDDRPDEVIKREIYETRVAPTYDVVGVVDDRDKVVRMWREQLGLMCAQVADGDF